MWIDIKTGDIANTHSDVRALRPNWSAPNVMTDEMVAEAGFTLVMPSNPSFDAATQEATLSGATLLEGVWTQKWVVTTLSEDAIRERAKASRKVLVDNIKVTTSALHVFDGDEVSQNRMARAIIALNAAEAGTTINWTLADNAVLQVTAAELTEALALAGAAQASVWVI